MPIELTSAGISLAAEAAKLSLEYSYSLKIPYKDFVAQDRNKTDIPIAIGKSIREAVGSIENLIKDKSNQIDARLVEVRNNTGSTTENLEILSVNLASIESSLDVLNSNLVSGFQALFVKVEELGASLAHLNRNVEALVEVAKSPVQTWALNHYNIARDMVRRRLYPEALEALQYAIHGTHQNTGYKSDFRFHLLRGKVLLGIPGEPESAECIDLQASEEAFLLASRYARHDDPIQAAQALVGAGSAAYAAGRPSVARTHLLNALAIDKLCGEANFQIARMEFADANVEAARHYLRVACFCHWSFAVRAATTKEFLSKQETVADWIRQFTMELKKHFGSELSKLTQFAERMKEYEDTKFRLTEVAWQVKVRDRIDQAMTELGKEAFKAVFDVGAKIGEVSLAIKDGATRYGKLLRSRSDEITSRGKEKEKKRDQDSVDDMIILALVGAAILIFVIGILNSTDMQRPGNIFSKTLMFVFTAVVMAIPAAILAGIVGTPLFFLIRSLIKDNDQQKANKLRNRNAVEGEKSTLSLEQSLAAIEKIARLEN